MCVWESVRACGCVAQPLMAINKLPILKVPLLYKLNRWEITCIFVTSKVLQEWASAIISGKRNCYFMKMWKYHTQHVKVSYEACESVIHNWGSIIRNNVMWTVRKHTRMRASRLSYKRHWATHEDKAQQHETTRKYAANAQGRRLLWCLALAQSECCRNRKNARCSECHATFTRISVRYETLLIRDHPGFCTISQKLGCPIHYNINMTHVFKMRQVLS